MKGGVDKRKAVDQGKATTTVRSSKRLKGETLLHRVSTVRAGVQGWRKACDSDLEITNLIESKIKRHGVPSMVAISLVICTQEFGDNTGQGHTFAISQDDETLIVYDAHSNEHYYNGKYYETE